jgi:hypothetical protein
MAQRRSKISHVTTNRTILFVGRAAHCASPCADKCTGCHDAFALLHYRGDGDDNDCLASIAPPGQPGGAPMMDRRIFLTIVAGLLAAPLAARSQQAVKEGCSWRARSDRPRRC